LEWGSDEDVADVESSLKALPLGRAWAATVALLLARTRRYDDAQEWLDSISEHILSTRPFDSEWMQMAACALEAGALVRDSRIAAVISPLIQPYTGNVVVLSKGFVCLGSTARFAGLAAATIGDWALADQNFDTAVTVNQKLEAYPALAHTQAEWGWALLAQGRRGDNKRAEALLTRARDLADELDMRRLAADIRVRRGGR
jgi:tetratricopeptide (TPR) repeat protein